jgi:hypothetical protein
MDEYNECTGNNGKIRRDDGLENGKRKSCHVKRVGASWITTVQDDPSLDGLQWRFLQQDESTRQTLIGLQTPSLFLVNVCWRNTGLKRETEHGRRAGYPRPNA